METIVYRELASSIQARLHCLQEESQRAWVSKHEDRIEELVDCLPHGSGIDGKTELDIDRSNGSRIVLTSSYHCMDEHGYYDGWIDFAVVVTPSFSGIDIDVRGRFSDRHGKYADVKDYLAETFCYGMSQRIEVTAEGITLLA